MVWHYDGAKVKEHTDEALRFWEHARHDDPPGMGEILGRPLQHPEGPVLEPQVPTTNVNVYQLHINQLYEAGIIDAQQYNTMYNKIYG
jgi:hypothetical protein